MIRLLKVNILLISVILLNASLFGDDFEHNVFRKFPYLIYTGENTEMKILWQTTNSYPCVINWGLDSLCDMKSNEVYEYSASHQYAFIVSDLIPNQKYYYQIKVENTLFKGSFKSAPSENDSSTTLFVYGDTHYGTTVHDQIAKIILEKAQNDEAFQSIILHTGDIIGEGDKESFWDDELFNPQYSNIRKLLGSFPFQACLGNHDMDYYANSSLYAKYLPYPYIKGRYWSFDFGPAHIFMFDIYSRYHGYGFIEDYEKFFFEQLDHLKNDLASTDKEWKFLVLHDPGWPAVKEYNWRVREYLQPICLQYNIDIVFAGHHHIYSHANINGVHHITTGGGGRLGLEKPLIMADEIVFAEQVHHYCQVVINGKNLFFTVYNLDGIIIDEFMISHPKD